MAPQPGQHSSHQPCPRPSARGARWRAGGAGLRRVPPGQCPLPLTGSPAGRPPPALGAAAAPRPAGGHERPALPPSPGAVRNSRPRGDARPLGARPAAARGAALRSAAGARAARGPPDSGGRRERGGGPGSGPGSPWGGKAGAIPHPLAAAGNFRVTSKNSGRRAAPSPAAGAPAARTPLRAMPPTPAYLTRLPAAGMRGQPVSPPLPPTVI